MAMPGGPYGKLAPSKTHKKKARRRAGLLYFEKKEMRFFQNKTYISADNHQTYTAVTRHYDRNATYLRALRRHPPRHIPAVRQERRCVSQCRQT